MNLVVSAAAAVLLALASSISVGAIEADLEWDVGSGARWITSASSILRFANDSAPRHTEWIGVGWQSGSLSLQHRGDGSTHMVFQLTPPSSGFQAILGKASAVTEPHYQSTVQGPSQVRLEAKIHADPKLHYRFKVEAHHDIRQNRTTYEALYSSADHWVYMGSLVLQHATAAKSAASTTSTESSASAAQKLAGEASTVGSGSGPDSDSDSDSDDSDSDADGGSRSHRSKALYARPTGVVSFVPFLRSGVSSLRKRMSQRLAWPAAVTRMDAGELEVPAFPHIFSGLRQMDGGDSGELRAGVYKRFQLRDRLGETFFISKANAFLYDAADNDQASARHYFLASSYLLTLNGPAKQAEDTFESSSSSESSDSSQESETSESSESSSDLSESSTESSESSTESSESSSDSSESSEDADEGATSSTESSESRSKTKTPHAKSTD
ncbi:hypothetical protein H4R19_002846 [Coemansia spiralis]|nr:hypothetical protein H4R19_002846 [Coemansia spiralis]